MPSTAALVYASIAWLSIWRSVLTLVIWWTCSARLDRWVLLFRRNATRLACRINRYHIFPKTFPLTCASVVQLDKNPAVSPAILFVGCNSVIAGSSIWRWWFRMRHWLNTWTRFGSSVWWVFPYSLLIVLLSDGNLAILRLYYVTLVSTVLFTHTGKPLIIPLLTTPMQSLILFSPVAHARRTWVGIRICANYQTGISNVFHFSNSISTSR